MALMQASCRRHDGASSPCHCTCHFLLPTRYLQRVVPDAERLESVVRTASAQPTSHSLPPTPCLLLPIPYLQLVVPDVEALEVLDDALGDLGGEVEAVVHRHA